MLTEGAMGGPHWQSKTATHGAREGAVAHACGGSGLGR